MSAVTTLPRAVPDNSVASSEFAFRSHNEANSAGVSWAAIVGGTFVFASISTILLTLGTGLGFTAISPWSNLNNSAATVTKAAIAWFVVSQIIASALGGYLAGRLRTKWVDVHTDEVYFRDTAHGLITWALGLVLTVAVLGSVAAYLAGSSNQRNLNGNAANGAAEGTFNPNAYAIDKLFRSTTPVAGSLMPIVAVTDVQLQNEADRIFAQGMRDGQLSSADSSYLAQLVAVRTGIAPADAQARVSDIFDEVRRNAETTRKAVAHLCLWLFVALLGGAFFSSLAGTIGGRQRDFVRV
jgi:hypothetical protein